MKYTITIVGIRKYLPNGEEDYPKLFSRLPVGSTVYLRKEPTGSEYPGSVSVLDDDCCKIGSVSKTERRYIELDIAEGSMLEVMIVGHSAQHNCMYFEAENHNGVKEPFIREVELEEGETVFPMAKQDGDLLMLTELMKTKLERLKNEQTVSHDHFLKTAEKYARLCCSSLDGNTSFSRADIIMETRQLMSRWPQLEPIYNEMFEQHKDIGRLRNDVKTATYRSQFERIKQMAMKKDANGHSPLDYYVKDLRFRNGDRLTKEIVDKAIIHLSGLLSKELHNSYQQNIDCDENFATALYSLNYSMKAIYRMFTRRIKLDHLKEIKKSLDEGSETTRSDDETLTAQRGQQKEGQGSATAENRVGPETGWPLSGSLDTKRAWSYFEKAVSKGWIAKEGNKLMWLGIGGKAHLSQLAYFCGKVFGYRHSVNGNTGTEFPKNELEELFGVKNLYSLLRQVHEAKGKQKWRACIDELFE